MTPFLGSRDMTDLGTMDEAWVFYDPYPVYLSRELYPSLFLTVNGEPEICLRMPEPMDLLGMTVAAGLGPGIGPSPGTGLGLGRIGPGLGLGPRLALDLEPE